MAETRERGKIATAYPHAARPAVIGKSVCHGSDDWRHAAGSSRTRGGSSAHREGVKAADPSLKRVDELLVCQCAAQSHVGQTSLAACPTLRSGDGQEHLEAEAGDRLGRSA